MIGETVGDVGKGYRGDRDADKTLLARLDPDLASVTERGEGVTGVQVVSVKWIKVPRHKILPCGEQSIINL